MPGKILESESTNPEDVTFLLDVRLTLLFSPNILRELYCRLLS